MAASLADRHCVDCKPGTPQLPLDEVERLLQQVDGWAVEAVEVDDRHQQLEKIFKFKGFMPAVDLVNRIAAIAEAEGHHPDLQVRYGSLTVQLWTHTAGGLTDNDFILAAKIDQVAGGLP